MVGMRATYMITDQTGGWVDMPEAEPRTRARMRDVEGQFPTLRIEDDGTITGDLDLVVLDTTYDG